MNSVVTCNPGCVRNQITTVVYLNTALLWESQNPALDVGMCLRTIQGKFETRIIRSLKACANNSLVQCQTIVSLLTIADTLEYNNLVITHTGDISVLH